MSRKCQKEDKEDYFEYSIGYALNNIDEVHDYLNHAVLEATEVESIVVNALADKAHELQLDIQNLLEAHFRDNGREYVKRKYVKKEESVNKS